LPLAANPLPFGLRDVKIAPMVTPEGTTYGTLVDLPAGRTLSFQEAEDSEELRGDDVLVAVHGNGPVVNWDLEGGGISLEAFKVLAGGAITNSGTTPNEKKTLAKLGTDARPYFKIEGQIIGDSGGDLHVVIYKAKVTGDVGGDFTEGGFFLTGASGQGIARSDSKLWDLVQNETAAAIA
jgi:hypothetical protein